MEIKIFREEGKNVFYTENIVYPELVQALQYNATWQQTNKPNNTYTVRILVVGRNNDVTESVENTPMPEAVVLKKLQDKIRDDAPQKTTLEFQLTTKK
jgi:hypothetical protein